MRVNHTLLRELLEGVEQAPGPEISSMPELLGYAPDVQLWHARLLVDGGYVTARQPRPHARAEAVALTIAGQQLLDTLRDSGSGPSLARSAGQLVERIATGAAVGLLMTKARALGIDLPS